MLNDMLETHPSMRRVLNSFCSNNGLSFINWNFRTQKMSSNCCGLLKLYFLYFFSKHSLVGFIQLKKTLKNYSVTLREAKMLKKCIKSSMCKYLNTLTIFTEKRMTSNDVALDISPTPIESTVNTERELGDLEVVTKQSKSRKDYSRKKLALVFICYGVAILLLSLNISTNTVRVPVQSDGRNNHSNNESSSENRPNCHVNEMSKFVTLTCNSNQKTYSLGKGFNFKTCDYH